MKKQGPGHSESKLDSQEGRSPSLFPITQSSSSGRASSRSGTPHSSRLTPIITPASSPEKKFAAGFPVTPDVIKPVAVRKKSIDDSHVNTAGSPLRTSYHTPPPLHESGGLSENSAFRGSDEAASLFRRSSYRSSIGSARRSSARRSVDRFSLDNASSIATQKLTIAEIVFDDFKILEDQSAADNDKKEALERLHCIFSTERGQPYIQSLIRKLTAEREALTRELRLSDLIKSIVTNVLSEKTLKLEYEWQALLVAIVQAAQQSIESPFTVVSMANISDIVQKTTAAAKEGKDDEAANFFDQKIAKINFSKLLSETKQKLDEIIQALQAVQISRGSRFAKIAVAVIAQVKSNPKADKYRILHNAVDEEVRSYCQVLTDSKYLLIAESEVTDLGVALSEYFLFRAKQERFLDKLAETIFTELEGLEQHYQTMSVTNDDGFYPVLISEYQKVQTNEILEFTHRQAMYTHTSVGITESPSCLPGKDLYSERYAALGESKERAATIDAAASSVRADVSSYLDMNPQMQLDQLNGSSKDELANYYDGYKSIGENISNQITSVNEQILECEARMQAILGEIKTHPTFIRKGTARSSIATILSQSMDVLQVDGEGKNPLDHAIECEDLRLIAIILANANASHVLVPLLNATLLKLRDSNDKSAWKCLIAGAYLFDPVGGGLYNTTLVRDLYQHKESDDDTFADRLSSSAVTPTRDSSVPPVSDKISRFFTKEYRPILTEDEQAEINAQVLEQIDDKGLADFIKKVEHGNWPHPVKYEASEIRAELTRRYVDEDGNSKTPVSDHVCDVLNKNLAVAERGERLATFYDKQTRHVCESYAEDPDLSTDKASLILRKFKKSAENLNDLEAEAADIANEFVDPNSDLGRRRSGWIPDLHSINKTQRLFADARKMLPTTGFLSSMQRGWLRLTNTLMRSGYQNDCSVLERPIATVDAGLTDVLLKKIPLTSQEKEACVKRAALARGVFKNTLEYLESRRYTKHDKRQAVEAHIQNYVNGQIKAEDLVAQLETVKDKTLKSQEWYGLWAKSERLMNRDLANAEAFKALDAKTVTAGC